MSLGKVRSCYRRQMPVPYPTPNVECYTWTPSHHHLCLSAGAQITSLRMTSSCPDYLHAGVSDYLHAGVIDAGDVSLHKQEMTDAQLVTVGTVDSHVASECHLCCPPPGGGHFPRHSLPK